MLQVTHAMSERTMKWEVRMMKSLSPYYQAIVFINVNLRPISGGQTCDQEAAVQWTFHLERSSFFYLSVLMVRTLCSAY